MKQDNQHLNRRIVDIDLLRAVAVMLTLGAHIRTLFPWPSHTIDTIVSHMVFWDGVDLFFAISGFVIMRDLSSNFIDSSTHRLHAAPTLSFWVRRAFRILPSAWLWLGIGLCGTLFFNTYGSFGAWNINRNDAIAAVFQVANLHLWLCQKDGSCGFNPVYWSLSLEEQFYITLPLLILLFRRRLFPVVALLWIIAVAIPRPLPGLMWTIRTDAILIGVMLALPESNSFLEGCARFLRERAWLARLAAATLIALLCVGPGFAIDGKAPLFPGATELVSLVCGALVVVAFSNGGLLGHRFFMKKIGLWIGSRSYAIYLVHVPAVAITHELWLHVIAPSILTPNLALRLGCTAVALICILAELNYRLVETPLRRVGAKVASRIATQNGFAITSSAPPGKVH